MTCNSTPQLSQKQMHWYYLTFIPLVSVQTRIPLLNHASMDEALPLNMGRFIFGKGTMPSIHLETFSSICKRQYCKGVDPPAPSHPPWNFPPGLSNSLEVPPESQLAPNFKKNVERTLSGSLLTQSLPGSQNIMLLLLPEVEVIGCRMLIRHNLDETKLSENYVLVCYRRIREIWEPINSLLMAQGSNLLVSLQKHPLTPTLMKIFMWNVRGEAASIFKQYLMEYINAHKPGILILTETKVSGQKARDICDSLPYSNFEIEDARGSKGGIWILWNEREIKLEIVGRNEQTIQAVIQVNPNSPKWLLSAIYASPKLYERINCWNHIRQVALSFPLPWLLVGDFNEVLHFF
ncbi:hypothetical protein ACH5RR_038098 [Cinchona calisaya]|uniref:Endonuclease/exonuclease/phosphatase domain-containing protein n=1 Tax=Cinchona calisaya TaxID=153742 RepID=A0ABD2YBT9_9GENT